MEFSKKIKKLRIAKGLTQKQIADYLNVSQNAIYNWENGKREPNMDMQKQIAKFFDFPLYLLLDDNFELENVELEMKRARPVNSYEMTEPPKPFAAPLSQTHNKENGIYIHSNATPLGDFDPKYAPFVKRFEDNNIKFKLVGCSGHAYPFDLIEIIDLIKPKLLIPIHSHHPERLYNKSGDVLLPEKKQTI